MKRRLAGTVLCAGLGRFIVAAILLSLIGPGSTVEAQDIQYQLIVQAMPTKTCIQPPKNLSLNLAFAPADDSAGEVDQ